MSFFVLVSNVQTHWFSLKGKVVLKVPHVRRREHDLSSRISGISFRRELHGFDLIIDTILDFDCSHFDIIRLRLRELRIVYFLEKMCESIEIFLTAFTCTEQSFDSVSIQLIFLLHGAYQYA